LFGGIWLVTSGYIHLISLTTVIVIMIFIIIIIIIIIIMPFV